MSRFSVIRVTAINPTSQYVNSVVPCGRSSMDVTGELDGEGIPRLRFPEPFNAAEYFIDRHIAEGRGNKVAIRTLNRDVTYAELFHAVNQVGNTLTNLGIGRGERILIVVKDCPEFFFLFWGAVKVGVIPVPLNGLAPASDAIRTLSPILNHPKARLYPPPTHLSKGLRQ